MCKKQRNCANQCANLVEPGGAILFILYTSLHLKQGYLSTRWSGGAIFHKFSLPSTFAKMGIYWGFRAIFGDLGLK